MTKHHQHSSVFLLLLLVVIGAIITITVNHDTIKPTLQQPLAVKQVVIASENEPGTLELGVMNKYDHAILAKARVAMCASRDTLYVDLPFESAPTLIKPGKTKDFRATINVYDGFPEGLYTCSLLISDGREQLEYGEFFLVVT